MHPMHPASWTEAAWLAASLLLAAAWVRLALQGLASRRHLDSLRGGPTQAAADWPRLSAIVPCRDEAAMVEAALRSLLGQDYPDLEVVAVDDRSTDGTGAILDRLAAEDRRLMVVHVDRLPEGWLGKSHACALGAARATGAWLLFTDGDVTFAPGTLRRSVAYGTAHGLGHLVALPRLVAHGIGERAFVATFALFATFAFRVWELRRPRTAGFIGVGAFNLVRASDYRRVGGHARLRLEVVDDVKLGMVLRRSSVPQGAVDSEGLVSVRWQAGLLRSVAGLAKNAFAGVEYRWSAALLAAAAIAVLSAGPSLLLVATPIAAARAAAGFACALSVAAHAVVVRRFGAGSGAEALFFPVCGLALAGVFLASAGLATWRGAVVWRGTRYPLASLRAGCVRAADWPAAGAVGWR